MPISVAQSEKVFRFFDIINKKPRMRALGDILPLFRLVYSQDRAILLIVFVLIIRKIIFTLDWDLILLELFVFISRILIYKQLLLFDTIEPASDLNIYNTLFKTLN